MKKVVYVLVVIVCSILLTGCIDESKELEERTEEIENEITTESLKGDKDEEPERD